jgi:hypothetical protein
VEDHLVHREVEGVRHLKEEHHNVNQEGERVMVVTMAASALLDLIGAVANHTHLIFNNMVVGAHEVRGAQGRLHLEIQEIQEIQEILIVREEDQDQDALNHHRKCLKKILLSMVMKESG